MPKIDAPDEVLDRDGRLWLRDLVPAEELRTLKLLWELHDAPGARVHARTPLFNTILNGAVTKEIVRLWPDMRPVRLVAFDKTAELNWGVPWHRDRVIAVKERIEAPGFFNWSNKRGQWHCEPPQAILEEMLFVRVHLDASLESNGAMQIAIGSHRAGKTAIVKDTAAEFAIETTAAAPGDVLVLLMLTLHRSLPAQSGEPRRALRIDYASRPLPPPLAWAV